MSRATIETYHVQHAADVEPICFQDRHLPAQNRHDLVLEAGVEGSPWSRRQRGRRGGSRRGRRLAGPAEQTLPLQRPFIDCWRQGMGLRRRRLVIGIDGEVDYFPCWPVQGRKYGTHGLALPLDVNNGNLAQGPDACDNREGGYTRYKRHQTGISYRIIIANGLHLPKIHFAILLACFGYVMGDCSFKRESLSKD
jgi:hypothetical protein